MRPLLPGLGVQTLIDHGCRLFILLGLIQLTLTHDVLSSLFFFAITILAKEQENEFNSSEGQLGRVKGRSAGKRISV
jgi:hypothetical protein